ncbi:hypothetical protein Pgy4_40612, partial [Pseudomonas savastanoi pv. glycinea str. race 4]
MTTEKKPRAEGDLPGVNMTMMVSTPTFDHRSIVEVLG